MCELGHRPATTKPELIAQLRILADTFEELFRDSMQPDKEFCPDVLLVGQLVDDMRFAAELLENESK